MNKAVSRSRKCRGVRVGVAIIYVVGIEGQLERETFE